MSPVDQTPVPLWARDIASDFKSAPETLSSWDNCMAKSYCKWPVIAAIIVGSVIVIAILACIINCLCCGIQCCRCCGCCSCCCPKPRNKRPKYMDNPYDPPFNTAPPPMPPPPANPYAAPPGPPSYRGQQVARFDAPSSHAPSSPAPSSRVNDDALPAMPTWDSAVSRRIEDKEPHAEAVEMEPLNPLDQGPRRTPSNNRLQSPGYMGPPPMRTGTSSSYYPESNRPYDEQSMYRSRSPIASPGPISPYEQPYRDHNPGYPFQSMSPAPTFTPQPQQYMPVGAAVSPGAETPRPIPYRQPSPGPNFMQSHVGQAVSHGPDTYQAMPMPYRQPSPGLGSIGTALSTSPGPRPIPYRQPSPGLPTVPQASAMNQPPVFREMSPSIPSSPPPPFTAVAGPHETTDPGRPPSLLQSGRKPVPNSYKDV